jgi:type II secretory ATPase GspE/PulE/Tfp pilus assembly ATPase PilB-like protein
MNRPDRKIITAEDPVEYYLPGINQVEVRHNIGLDFARIIRSMLRQAPNIILVGEMRDAETVSMGIQASLTGHLVFSTLHTNDAPSAITRMVDMGVPSYLVASSVVATGADDLLQVQGKIHPAREYHPRIGNHSRGTGWCQFHEGQRLQHLPEDWLQRSYRHLRTFDHQQ